MPKKDEKRDMIQIAKELPYITKEDIAFFKYKETTATQIQNRMIVGRKRWK